MTRLFTMLFAAALFAGAAGAANAQYAPGPYGPNAGPSTAPSPVPLSTAKRIFAQLQAGKIDPSQLATGTPYVNMNGATLANAQRMVGGLGPPVSFVQTQSTTQGNSAAGLYIVTFQNGQKVDFLLAIDSQGKIEGMSLGTPH